MKYLIKLENRIIGNEAFIVCPADITLEDLSVKVKLELCLPYSDYGRHSFGCMGKVYVPDACDVESYYEIDSAGLPNGREKYAPLKRDLRSTERYRLQQVFTVKGSSLNYLQYGASRWDSVRCTLVERIL